MSAMSLDRSNEGVERCVTWVPNALVARLRARATGVGPQTAPRARASRLQPSDSVRHELAGRGTSNGPMTWPEG